MSLLTGAVTITVNNSNNNMNNSNTSLLCPTTVQQSSNNSIIQITSSSSSSSSSSSTTSSSTSNSSSQLIGNPTNSSSSSSSAVSSSSSTSGSITNPQQSSVPTTTTTSTTTVVASKQILNNSTIKLVQRLLDEASQTGDLLLSNKNLNEFPSKLAVNYDLSDTITADLSRNHLTEFPKELCTYDSLEKLTLYANLIRTIPDITVYQLKCLKFLDLNSNNLSYLPPCLCNLASLEVLTVNNNKLVSLPEEIGRLDKLIQLDVSCNEITHLPVQIGDMNSLRALNVRRNLLVELPKEISQLKLVSFDCSSNRLNKLPLCFREMVTLIDLVVDHNPLEVPPAHICTKGLLHIMKYLLVEAIKEEKKRGILTEYEINTQYNNFNYNLSAHHQRLSCTAGLGYMFQSSVRSMSKKLGSSSIPSSSMSTVSSSSSTSSSSSVSSSSLSSQIQTHMYTCNNNNNNNNKQIKSSFIDLPPPQQPPPPPPPLPPSLPIQNQSSQSASSSLNTTPTNHHHHSQFFNQSSNQSFSILNINNNYKLNNDMENVDYVDAPSTSSPSSTKSSSSSTSSSSTSVGLTMPIKTTIKTQKIQETPNSKIVSIHELISLKSPNSNTYQQQQQQTNLNYQLKYNRTNQQDQQIQLEQQQFEQQQQNLWRLNNNSDNINNNKKLLHEEFMSICKSKHKLNESNNLSMNSGQNLLNSLSPINNSNNNKLINTKRLTSNDCTNSTSSNLNNNNNSNNTINTSYDILSNNMQKNLQIDGTSYSNVNIKCVNDKRYSNPILNSHKPQYQSHSTTVSKSFIQTNDPNERSLDDVSLNLIQKVAASNSNDEMPNSMKHYNSSNYLAESQSNNLNNNNTIMFNQDNFLDMIGNDLNNYIISVDNQEHISDEYNKYYKHQPSQQQVWVPRDDLTLSNGKELPSNLENVNPAFTIRRHIIQIQEEQKQIEALRKTIESRLKIQLPTCIDELGVSLSDGVVLCHLMNQIFPRAVQIIHVPSLAVPKLSLAKCRKNVENFIDACRRLGLPENDLCCAHDIIEAKNTPKVARTVIMLVGYHQYLQQQQQQQHQHQQDSSSYNNRQTNTIGNVMNHNGNHNCLQAPQQQQTAV